MAIGYQLKITIRGSKPPIWRRVIVPEHIAFCDLDDIIEKIFGWTHGHLYEFFIKDWGMRITGAPLMEEDDNAEECIDSWMKVGSEIFYTYDFGDNWEHLIKIEKIVEYEHRYPVVLKSKGPNMIEDCGGIWGFYDCIEEAEPFDMEAVNEEFRSWVLPIAEPLEELMGLFEDEDDDFELDGFIDDIEDDFFDFENDEEVEPEWETNFRATVSSFVHEDNYVRHTYGDLQSLEEVYAQFTKEDLVGMAFRDAYKITGRLVAYCIANGFIFETLPLEVYREYSELFGEDVYKAIDLETCVNERKVYGGPAEVSTRHQIEIVRNFIA